MIIFLKIIIGCYGAVIGGWVIKGYIRHKENVTTRQKCFFGVFGFVIYVMDALGIGSFSPTLAGFKLTKTVDDRLIPGTMDCAATPPTALEAILFMTVVQVEPLTLVTMCITGIAGALVGSKAAVKLPLRPLQIAMGSGLFAVGIMLVMSKFGLMPLGGDAMGLHGMKLVIACAVGFILASLLSVGIGNYAPTMVLVYLLGMNPAAAFPIMMSLGAFGLASASIPYLQAERVNYTAVVFYTIPALIGVYIAVKFIGSLPLSALQWLVIVVVFYSSFVLLYQALYKTERK